MAAYNPDNVHDVTTTWIQEDVLKYRLLLAEACRLIHGLLNAQLTVDSIAKAKQVPDLRDEAERFIEGVQFGSDIPGKAPQESQRS